MLLCPGRSQTASGEKKPATVSRSPRLKASTRVAASRVLGCSVMIGSCRGGGDDRKHPAGGGSGTSAGWPVLAAGFAGPWGEAVRGGEGGELGATGAAGLAEQRFQVAFHGAGGDVEAVGDLWVGSPGGDQGQLVGLPGGDPEGGEPGRDLGAAPAASSLGDPGAALQRPAGRRERIETQTG